MRFREDRRSNFLLPGKPESGFASVEWLLGLAMLLSVLFLLQLITWPERLNLAADAAYQAARAVAEAPSYSEGVATAEARISDMAANHDIDPATVRLTVSGALDRGAPIAATVHVDLPAVWLPVGVLASRTFSKTATARVPDYRSFS